MIKQKERKPLVQKRHKSIRVKVSGTAEFPRLAVYRSTKHIYAQLIDDENHVTLASASSTLGHQDLCLRGRCVHGHKVAMCFDMPHHNIEKDSGSGRLSDL